MADEGTGIRLLADYLDGKPVFELVPAVQTGKNRYRLTASPGYAAGVASGDEIEFVPSEPKGYRVLNRSGNLCVQVFLNSCSARDRESITSIVRSIGGWLDGGKDGISTGHLLIYDPGHGGLRPHQAIDGRGFCRVRSGHLDVRERVRHERRNDAVGLVALKATACRAV